MAKPNITGGMVLKERRRRGRGAGYRRGGGYGQEEGHRPTQGSGWYSKEGGLWKIRREAQVQCGVASRDGGFYTVRSRGSYGDNTKP